MFYINKRTVPTEGNSEKAMKEQRKRLTEERLTDELAYILNNAAGKKLRWKDSTTDLMEVVYTAYMSGSIYDDSGKPCSFKELVHSACRALHVPEPANPRSYIYRAQNRKGIRQEPFINRYGRMIYKTDIMFPLRQRLNMI
ncbi:MAG: hypothetical protein KHX42_03960 [Prevotella sp.]|nr:hypothetical protein [Prevotella sp.]